MNAITRLTPHMQAYSEECADNGDINWLPYLMYFNPFGFSLPVVNTDASGFRHAEARNRSYSVAGLKGKCRMLVLAGNSTVFGIGAGLHRCLLGQPQSGRAHNTLVAPQGGVYAAHSPCAREMAQPRRSLALAEADQ